MNDFYIQVYDVVKKIPYGRVTSYGAIAKYLGASKSSRIIGYALNLSHNYDSTIPAHRVVNRNGLLTGKAHFNPPEKMQQLLESEGIKVIDDQVQNFENIFWNPYKELF